jgi:hypothetical protein
VDPGQAGRAGTGPGLVYRRTAPGTRAPLPVRAGEPAALWGPGGRQP